MAAGSTTAALLLFLLCSPSLAAAAGDGEVSSYVVYLGQQHAHGGAALGTRGAEERETLPRDAADAHYDLLAGVFGGDKKKAREVIFCSYSTKHINGFAANLDAATAAEIARQPGVISVFPNHGLELHLHTTRSWQFLVLAGHGGVPRGGASRKARFGEDTIIENFDTDGSVLIFIWPLATLLTAVFSPRMDRKVAALMMAVFGVMTCDTALAIYNDDRGDLSSATFVLAAYTNLLVLISIFLREFAGRARGVDAAAHIDVRLEGGVA